MEHAVLDEVVAKSVTAAPYTGYTIAPKQLSSADITNAIHAMWQKEISFQPTPTYSFGNYYTGPMVNFSQPETTAHTLLRERLAMLGGTPLEARDSMRKLGIQAIPGNTNDCAIARWLKQVHYPQASAVSVGPGAITVYDGGEVVTVSTPPALRNFIRMFDGCQFPELVSPRYMPFTGELTFGGSPVPGALVDAVSCVPGAD